MRPLRRVSILAAGAAGVLFVVSAAQPRTPAAAVAELLDADRALSSAAATTPLPPELATRLSLDSSSRARWAPIRGGISADATHGFTFGFAEVRNADGIVVAGKYLAYWVKGDSGWRVAAYRRVRRGAGDTDGTMLPPALPAALVAPSHDSSIVAAHRESLMQAERDFAAAAQVIGLRAAFAAHGSTDAMNMGGPLRPGFVLGADAISRAVAEGVPDGASPVNWGPERALVASSGDLGVTFGTITSNAEPAAGQPRRRIPFFTIWRRAGPGAPWRYVAE